jgi:hypothetical protein
MLNAESNSAQRGNMATLVWDKIGERVYQTGVDRGVLYLHDGTAKVWNGLTSVEESSGLELKEFHLDGVKYLQTLVPGDFSGNLKAYTYPEEFESISGINTGFLGLGIYEQPVQSFNLSYRTRIGDDIAGTERGYKIHILYNITALPSSYTFDTFTDSAVQPIEFSWDLSGTPEKLEGFRPSVHVSIDSTKTTSELLKQLEDVLYGTSTSDPRLPSLQELAEYFGYLGALIIVDYGNGVWAAVDETDTFITMIDTTTFQIDNADATYLDTVTYEISSTNVTVPR